MRLVLIDCMASEPIGRPDAGTARDLPQLRISSIFSGLVCDSGITLLNASKSRSSVMMMVGLAICR